MSGQVEIQKTSKSVQNVSRHTGTKKEKLTQKRLKELLHYDPDTGVFRWRVDRGRLAKAGDRAGFIGTGGYFRITIYGMTYGANRLAYFYMDGYFPEHSVDHRDGDTSNDRWKNLRHVTHACNLQNQKKYTNNTSGFPGVYPNEGGVVWRSSICLNGKSSHLGYYNDPLEAALARYTAEVQCPLWTCNHRSELVKAIIGAWPEFKPSKCI